ncbi:hypothetical protein DL766_002050 [Monosporascus sp. MC13-8B]|uniref:HMG box domain-containing protein n=1 Tax=Monosporascus cannonballus TaxID=155416 RepID=A0ABY0HGH3_9PEZI|nr:hypothetical protein DL762_002265 [Monosporascus cannonballus]RYO95007.1 hypothetical protein DL763_003903 [Monosporascus cannonballus]RYP36388.1 hypothetical protein DL766_002050 [Monosporascus sp. MC13-8B]
MTSLESIFGELGISQYLDAFLEQGFDSWDTILDITESDLDALGVKLGHRRKLQRRIANSRGLAPEVSLVSSTRTSIEDGKYDPCRPEAGKPENREAATVTKRKYRRHPKPDENAPERPPSAYVLFSNKMREDLKGRNLTFTEIAKLVGENWQNLTPTEKDPFETQAQDAKDKYNRDLAEYKKTENYRKYNEYLQEFRAKQAAQAQEKDASKRIKTGSDSTPGSSTSAGSTGPSGTASGAVSGSESQHGSEPPPSRQQRMGSSVSAYEAQFSTGMNGTAGQYQPDDGLYSPRSVAFDDTGHGRPRGLSSPNPSDAPILNPQRRRPWPDGQHITATSPAGLGFPWFSQGTDPTSSPGTFARSPDSMPSLTPSQSDSSGHRSRSSASYSRPPSLRTEPSSTGSISSLGSHNLPRTPSDASLPIHALLSSRLEPTYAHQRGPSSMNPPAAKVSPPILQPHSGRSPGDPPVSGTFTMSPASSDQRATQPGFAFGEQAYPPFSLAREPPYATSIEPKPLSGMKPASPSEPSLDGISALLKAREIVDRRTH